METYSFNREGYTEKAMQQFEEEQFKIKQIYKEQHLSQYWKNKQLKNCFLVAPILFSSTVIDMTHIL